MPQSHLWKRSRFVSPTKIVAASLCRLRKLVVDGDADVLEGEEARCIAYRAAIDQRRRSRKSQTSGDGSRHPRCLVQIGVRRAAGAVRALRKQQFLAEPAREDDLQTLMIVVVSARQLRRVAEIFLERTAALSKRSPRCCSIARASRAGKSPNCWRRRTPRTKDCAVAFQQCRQPPAAACSRLRNA